MSNTPRKSSDAARVSLPGLFADRFDDTQLAYDLRADRVGPDHDEHELAETWRARKSVRTGKGYRVVIEASDAVLEALIQYAEAFANSAAQGDEPAEARACTVAAQRLRDAHVLLVGPDELKRRARERAERSRTIWAQHAADELERRRLASEQQ